MASMILAQKLAARYGRMPSLSIRACNLSSSSGSDKKGDEKPATSERAEEARGALKDFMKKAALSPGARDGIWAKLRTESIEKFKSDPNNINNNQQQQQQQKTEGQSASYQRPNTPRPFVRRDGPPRRDGPRPAPRAQGDSNANAAPAGTSDSGAASEQRQPRRSMNPRTTTYQNRRPPGGGADGTGGGGRFESRGPSGPRTSRRPRERGGDGARNSDGNIPPAIRAVLSEKAFDEMISKGYTIDTRNMDGVDAFLANVFMDALKTKKSQVLSVIESDEFRRTLIPKPRPTSELLSTLVPPISTAEAGSEGHALASEAWQTLSRNVFFNDSEKHLICNSLANKANKIYAAAALIKEVDMIYSSDFRKGYEGIEEEKRRMLLAQDDGSSTDYSKDDTNWEVEAVVDEDEL